MLRSLQEWLKAGMGSSLVEAVILAMPGSIVGVLVPWLVFNGNSASFVGLNFSLAVTPCVALWVSLAHLGIGLLGGMLPGT